MTSCCLLVLVQWGNTALLRAAEGGSVPLVRALLEDYGSSVNEVNEVSCSSNMRCYLVTMSVCVQCVYKYILGMKLVILAPHPPCVYKSL